MNNMNDKSSIDIVRHFGKYVLNNPESQARLPVAYYHQELRVKEQKKQRERLQEQRQNELYKALHESSEQRYKRIEADRKSKLLEASRYNLEQCKRSYSLRKEKDEVERMADQQTLGFAMARQKYNEDMYLKWKKSLMSEVLSYKNDIAKTSLANFTALSSRKSLAL